MAHRKRKVVLGQRDRAKVATVVQDLEGTPVQLDGLLM
jgi:hypothetical protein